MKEGGLTRFCIRLGILFVAEVLVVVPMSLGDDIYVTGADGKEALKAGGVIVKEEHEGNIRYSRLEDGMIVRGSCYWEKEKGEKARILRSTPQEKSDLLAKWSLKGFTAEVTDTKGSTCTVSNVALDFDPPDGYFIFVGPGWKDQRHYIELERGERILKFDFRDIEKLSVKGTEVELTLLGGGGVSGPLKYDSVKELRLVPKIEGLELLGKKSFGEFELDFAKVKTITFKHK